MKPTRVLFVCIHNSGRSQIAEAFLSKLGAGRFAAESAGFEPGTLNLVVVEAVREAGIDISKNRTKSVFDLFNQGRAYDYVITVCDDANSERCPIFPGAVGQRMHWSFPDPAALPGSPEERLEKTRRIRDQIAARVAGFVELISEGRRQSLRR